MGLIVQKYGGTSVGSIDRLRNVARRVAKTYEAGNNVVVVLSAMSGTTDRLIAMAQEACDRPDKRELDVLLATGEQTTVALLAMILTSMGYRATSLLGFQAEVITDCSCGAARILNIGASRIRTLLEDGQIVIVAGFQGADIHGNITTLGRGGSDTSAVAIAAALKAETCEIYTDVDGVYTTDPNICKKARKLSRVSYDEMLEMASLGAKVLQIRSVEFAKKYNVPVHVRSSFKEEEGTMVMQEDADMERLVVSGVTYNKNEARITLKGVPDRPGIAFRILNPIAEAGILVDMIIQNTRSGNITDFTFTVPKTDIREALDISKKVAEEIGAEEVVADPNIAKVSVIGVGMKNHSGVASRMFAVMCEENINMLMISTSEIRISCIIEEKYTELAVRALHTCFGLDKPEENILS
ncbi:aspartate kinase [Desulfobotulus sp. H1]|uniref:Aspartokinase n=1 Tax=Desulfobotulus pelophilus TaxID=2823377 RepID=A0ABT3N4U6_9BACT|nr:aspartate kinase [Desulfobotulus pelophilus]MCW7752480.1 aspartate kinase [Desulfobotulus pelophilus]